VFLLRRAPLRLGLCAALPVSAGCASLPRGAVAVDRIVVQGNDAVSASDLTERMATAESPRFLGLFQGLVHDYALFDRAVFQRDLERVERYYRARGFYEAHARAGRVRTVGEQHLEITVGVDEGPPVLVAGVRLEGVAELPAEDARAAREAALGELERGAPFAEEPFRKAEAALQRALADRGYAWAKVTRRADVDLPRREAALSFAVRPGPKATLGPIVLEGLGELPEAPVRRALDLAPGDAYSRRELDAAQRAVLDLGTFAAVSVEPVLAEPPPRDAVVPLRVRVEPQKLKSVLLGGGLEMDSLRTDLHLRVGWEHRNLLGGFRHFSVDLRPGVQLYPTRLPSFQAPTALLPEERLRVELRRPGFLEARTSVVVRQELDTYPLQLSANVDPRDPILYALEARSSVGLDRSFGKLFVAPGYNLQFDHPFAFRAERVPARLVDVTLSYVDLLAHLDLRDDRLHPHAGLYLQGDLQLAGLGGHARDVRVQPEVRAYLPVGKRVTLAARAALGLLFPSSYGHGRPRDPDAAVRDAELIYLRGFFSGGPSSNRGYPQRGVGPHGPLPFLDLAGRAAPACLPGDLRRDPAECAVPLGGLSLWEASLELRFPLGGSLGGVAFCDAGDVSPYRADIRLDHPHLSCGAGLRYDTPIGPVRLDVGVRIPGAQLPSGVDPRVDGDAAAIYGLPIAVAFGIGEVF
jgi:outer membrane protein insertion porin family/translocation and assembly module TamA